MWKRFFWSRHLSFDVMNLLSMLSFDWCQSLNVTKDQHKKTFCNCRKVDAQVLIYFLCNLSACKIYFSLHLSPKCIFLFLTFISDSFGKARRQQHRWFDPWKILQYIPRSYSDCWCSLGHIWFEPWFQWQWFWCSGIAGSCSRTSNSLLLQTWLQRILCGLRCRRKWMQRKSRVCFHSLGASSESNRRHNSRRFHFRYHPQFWLQEKFTKIFHK